MQSMVALMEGGAHLFLGLQAARLTSSLLGVDAGQGQVLPKHLKQVVQVQLHTTAAREEGGQSEDPLG